MSLRAAMVEDPTSVEIAARLNAAGAMVCEHGLEPCVLRCGVRCNPPTRRVGTRQFTYVGTDGFETFRAEPVYERGGPWEVIPEAERVAWAEHVDALTARDAARARAHRCAQE